MKAYEGVEVDLYSLTCALDEAEWSASWSAALPPENTAPVPTE